MSTSYLRVALLLPALLVLALLTTPNVALAAHACANAELVPANDNFDEISEATRCLINVERVKRGRRAVRASSQLQQVAEHFSVQMVDDRFFSHVSPRGTTLRNRVGRGTSYLRGSRNWSLGENLAWGSGRRATPRYVVSSWMRSSVHRRHVLNRSYQHLGLGIALGSPNGSSSRPAATYTADFGRRR